ncbi:MAG: hypothetical protein KBC73_11500 [Burkholderiaceae bacterium]|nr:hypothetical protein [Burkholderiaceae bacterium]
MSGSLAPRPLRWSPPRDEVDGAASSGPAAWRRWLAHRSGRLSRQLQRQADQALAQAEQAAGWDEARLDAELRRLRRALRLGDAGQRAQALGLVAEAAARTVERRPYRVQLLAALAMHEGLVVQMNAGEGKTLAVALAAVLHGWQGQPCHVVTANDYLAQRDAELMAPLYARCGVRAASVVHGLAIEVLQQAYAAELVYATSKQLLADHLCDQIVLSGATDATRRRIHELRPGGASQVRTRGLYAALVDEADSVMIDEANTPLIISAPQPNAMLVQAVLAARDIADGLQAGLHYRIDARLRAVDLTDAGRAHLEDLTRTLPPVWHAPDRRDDLVCQAISARDLFLRDRHYIVQDGKIEILDENTGRVMEGRTWSYGLHQAIEAREGVELTHPSKTLARMSFQDFFSRYHRLGGASGTLQGVHGEMWRVYGLPTFTVPTRVPSRLAVVPLRHFADGTARAQAVLDEVARLHALRLPVLVGTRRLEDSEALAAALAARGLACAVLNARQTAHEAAVVAAAGRPGSITVATNMAGRGTDILLDAAVREQGGLQVLMLEPHESARVDWQLFGRAGRQGQPGAAQPFVALDDDLLQRHLPWWLRPLLPSLSASATLRARLIAPLVRLAQSRAQRQAALQRRWLQQRERQIRKQLSFADDGR